MPKKYKDYYEYVTLEETGEVVAIDEDTGEVLNTVVIQAPVGTVAYTPAQQREYKERKEKELVAALRRNRNKKFAFVNAQYHYKDISPQSAGRLMFLSTFLGYNSNVLSKTQKTKMKKEDLPQIMRLPKTTFSNFWEDVYGKYLIENEDGTIVLSCNHFLRGKIPTQQIGLEWQILFVRSMQELYAKTPTTSHRYLGFAFQMLPFLNKEYNILCHNPDEETLENIQPMTLDEFCLECGYTNTEQRARLIKKYSQLRFEVDGHTEAFCSFVSSLNNIGDAKIYINPNILYKGTRWNEVKILGQFCK